MICSKDDYVQSVLGLRLIESNSIGNDIWNEIQSVGLSNIVLDINSNYNLPLGKLNEYIFGQLLRATNRFEVKGQNLQFVVRGVTIGEIDFLLFDKLTQRLVHLEIATKVYLKKKNNWVGPNLKDSLALKKEKYTNQLNQLHGLWENLEEKYQRPIAHVNLILGHQWNRITDEKITNYSYFSFNESFLKTLKKNNYVWALPQKKDWFIEEEVLSKILDFYNQIEPIKEVIELNRSPLVLIKKESTEEVFKCFITFWE